MGIYGVSKAVYTETRTNGYLSDTFAGDMVKMQDSGYFWRLHPSVR